MEKKPTINVVQDDRKDMAFGAYRFPGRKRPCICIRREGDITVCGSFSSDEAAEEFMDAVAEFFGITVKEVEE